jgi:hypothetical protein
LNDGSTTEDIGRALAKEMWAALEKAAKASTTAKWAKFTLKVDALHHVFECEKKNGAVTCKYPK